MTIDNRGISLVMVVLVDTFVKNGEAALKPSTALIDHRDFTAMRLHHGREAMDMLKTTRMLIGSARTVSYSQVIFAAVVRMRVSFAMSIAHAENSYSYQISSGVVHYRL